MSPEHNDNNNEWLKLVRIGLMIFVTFVCCILFFFFIFKFQGFASIWGKLMTALTPIIIGLVLAYLMNPIMKFIEGYCLNLLEAKRKGNERNPRMARAMAIVGSVVILLLIIAALIATIVPSLVSSISALINTLPSNVESFLDTIQHGNFGNAEITKIISNYITSFTDSIEKWAQTTLLPQAQKYVVQITGGVISVFRGVLNFIIGIVVMIYVMAIQETLTGQAKKVIYAVFNPVQGNVIIKVVRKANEIFGGFITGKILDSLIIGLICYIGCAIFRIPSAILVAVIVGVTNIVPVFGPFIGAVPSVFLVIIQSPIHALYLVIFIIVLQQVDGNIIGPKILGSSTGLSTFWVMFAILVGGGLFGFTGMLLGVPIFGMIYYIVKEVVNYILRKKNLSTKTNEYIELESIDNTSLKMIYQNKHEEIDKKTDEKH